MAVEISKSEHVLWLRINRPEAKNAVDFEVMDHLESAVDRIHSDETIRAFVITGTDDHFISGGDLKKFHQIRDAESAMKMAERIHLILAGLEKAPCWTISLVNGAAYGGGWELMLACDFRIASEKAVFGFTQGKFYLPPGWGGLTRLVEKVGRSQALLWLAEAAVIDSQTAHETGLIDFRFEHDELESKTMKWLSSVTRNDRMFIHNLKSIVLNSFVNRREMIRKELEPFSHFWEHDEHRNRVEEFLNRKSEQEN
jgi:enoyl-CoA hydratase